VGGTHIVEDWTKCTWTHRQTHKSDRHTKVKTVYPPVSLRSLGRYKNCSLYIMLMETGQKLQQVKNFCDL